MISLQIRQILTFASLAVLTGCGDAGDSSRELPRLAAATNATTVSGISSGAYMAGQFQVAHSADVIGAAIIAGGPYGCAESAFSGMVFGPAATMLNASKAVSGCMQNAMALWGVPNPTSLVAKTEKLSAEGAIDNISALKTDRVYLFSGKEDRTVVPAIVESAAVYYREIGIPPSNIKLVTDLPAGHGFVTENEGLACERTGEPYVVDCNYDQAKDLLTQLYGPLNPPSKEPAGRFMTFAQRPFTDDVGGVGLSDDGAVYVPDECRRSSCRVHIAFHGCAQNQDVAGDAFVRESGYARWADTNRIVVLFPQTKASAMNPQGCWDWWGYTGRDYLTKSALQIRAVHRMLQRLGEAN